MTEFGVTGKWDINQEKNGVKVEAIAKRYPNWIKLKPDF
jgi:hypothetical protein